MYALLQQYLIYFSCKNAASTVKRVTCQLKAFAQFLQSISVQGFHELDTGHFMKWNEHLKAKGHQRRTLAGEYSAVKGLMDWLYRENYFLIHPWPAYLRITCTAPLPKAVPSIRESLAFLDNLGENGRYPNRNRAIMELAYGSGLRRGELHGLNIGDIHGDWLKVRGKGGRERLVPLGSKAKVWLGMYMKGERMQLLGKINPLEEALFLSRYGSRLSMPAYGCLVTDKRPQGARWTLHSFRHACATHMLANGANIRVLQKLLGHKKLSSTQVYTRVDMSSLQEVLRKCHPRG